MTETGHAVARAQRLLGMRHGPLHSFLLLLNTAAHATVGLISSANLLICPPRAPLGLVGEVFGDYSAGSCARDNHGSITRRLAATARASDDGPDAYTKEGSARGLGESSRSGPTAEEKQAKGTGSDDNVGLVVPVLDPCRWKVSLSWPAKGERRAERQLTVQSDVVRVLIVVGVARVHIGRRVGAGTSTCTDAGQADISQGPPSSAEIELT